MLKRLSGHEPRESDTTETLPASVSHCSLHSFCNFNIGNRVLRFAIAGERASSRLCTVSPGENIK